MRLFRPILFVLCLPLLIYAQGSLLRSGPMVGYGQMTEVLLWVQTNEPASVQCEYWEQSLPKKIFRSETVQTTRENACIAKVIISDLAPGKKFEYRLLINDTKVDLPYSLRFQTQPFWQWRTDPPEFSVAFGSCAYINESNSDRPGQIYGGNYEIFKTILNQNPDLMLWLGDNTYLRENDWDTYSGIVHRYTHTRENPELQPLLGSVHHYAIWDDHDFGPNNSDRSYRLKEDVLRVFSMFWGNQTYGTRETPGVFGRFTWGDAEFFLLDDRYYRSPNTSPDEGKTMFGKEQLQWLKDCLSNSIASFKFVVNGNQILNRNGEFNESFTHFQNEYSDLVSYIKQNGIEGVIFLTGDRHHSELITENDSTFYTLYDFTASPFTAGLNPMKDRDGNWSEEYTNPQRVAGTLVNDKRSFGMIRCTGAGKERAVLLSVVDASGTTRWTKKILLSSLKVKQHHEK